jgi:hypothetical protein
VTQDIFKIQISEIPYCEQRHRLTEALHDAIRQFTDLHAQQMQSIIEGDQEFSRFDDLIHLARAAKDEAKYALVAHIDTHNC